MKTRQVIFNPFYEESSPVDPAAQATEHYVCVCGKPIMYLPDPYSKIIQCPHCGHRNVVPAGGGTFNL